MQATINPATRSYIPGPAIGHDWQYEQYETRALRREAAMEERVDEYRYFATTQRFTVNDRDVFERRCDDIADAIFGDGQTTSRLWLELLRLWNQASRLAPDSPERRLADLIGGAIEDCALAHAREHIQ